MFAFIKFYEISWLKWKDFLIYLPGSSQTHEPGKYKKKSLVS